MKKNSTEHLNARNNSIAQMILSLKHIRGIGPKRVKSFLINNVDLVNGTFKFDDEFLKEADDQFVLKKLNENQLSWDELQRQSKYSLDRGKTDRISFLHPFMEKYPRRLLELKNFPPVLFCKGNIDLLNEDKIVSIVGTRNPTSASEKVGLRLSEKFSNDGFVIVSGLALGSDTVGHQGSLMTTGKTIAILSNSLDDRVYPPENQKIAENILNDNGLLISEYEPGRELQGREMISNLVARDEWQPGISDGLVVLESGLKGGTRHAVQHAENTEKPIAVLDFRNMESKEKKLQNEFLNNPRFSENLMLLNKKKATGIYGTKTIIEFEREMDASKNERQMLYEFPTELLSTQNTRIEQTDLFDTKMNEGE